LDEKADPFALFQDWYQDALRSGIGVPDAMALATASPNGCRPSNRFVLLKGADRRGFIFYSNYESRKGDELDTNPYAAAAIFWLDPRRQVRIEGRVEKLAAEESDAYFRTRDRLSQIGAVASPQSRVILDRSELEGAVEELSARLAGTEVPRPAHWGGYLIVPDVMEFWTGRENRLHDRVRYRREPDGSWTVERLAP
jgi:pyridoxamine 5'-phosphate oxidase